MGSLFFCQAAQYYWQTARWAPTTFYHISQSAKLTWYFRSSWPTFDFQSPCSTKQFPYFYYLRYQVLCTFSKLWLYKMLHFDVVSFWFNHICVKNDRVLNYTFLSAGRPRHSVHSHFGPQTIEILWPTTIFHSICLRADH